jgi:hypothetical protein
VSGVLTVEHFRELNTILALLTVCGLLYRTPEALLNVSSKRLYVVLSLFPLAVGFASLQALILHAPAGPVTFVFTALYAALGLVESVFWPKALSGRPEWQTKRGTDG